ncbi:TPA: site-specific integrase [Vibrio parahaemolyticus]|uniref:site-specific integrase n=1 Tax=Vibrio parahaemolyticus TaxID=670 RepID=UPI00040576BD|nr:site-specific integrase [Vibrio parahaemolyticus]HBC3449609.1 site-specific integrase [Vibrio parahaemolyticus]HCE2791504.1 site-specific integrase [Vibrio parahaemolyticus]HCE2822838.1 site-specific integrase [Vibrio parahaemolyticus]HCE4869563.1 site-specific integrase [Vibrio parahaemolyticus]HCE4926323.1 site-specific integrase [Vibrio parahaemolyticus]
MAEIIYDIKTKTIKHFTYRKPSVFIDENGEPQYKYSPNKDNHTHIKKVIFLSLVGYEKVNLLDENDKPIKDEHGNPIFVKGDLVSYEPMNYVNEFILAKHVVDEKEDAQQASKALTHYFRFILDAQTKWDDRYDNEDYDPIFDPPRPAWDSFSPRKNLRVTTMYRNAVKKTTLDGTGLAKTTAMSYVRSMVDFYKYHLRQGMRFNNPPFEFETLLIDLETSGTDMKARKRKEIQTTDLKLTFPKSKKNDGGKLPNANRELKPLTNSEWREIKNILVQTRRVLKNVRGEEKLVSLPKEYCLLFRLLRYTGLRKEEGASVHLGQIIRPNTNDAMLRLGVGNQYGSLTKDPNGGYNNKSRRTIIPSSLMLELYEYSHSARYKKRLEKFRERCVVEREAGNDAYFDGVDGVDEGKQYLFISNSGVPLFKKLEEINTRWNEVRKTAGVNLVNDIDAVVHNLRATFAVSIFRTLLKKMNSDDALARVSALLGHEDLSTTLLYLQIAQDQPTGDEIWEDVLDYLGVFDEEEELDNLPDVEQTYKHEASQ